METKSQTGVEFLIMTGVVLLFFTIFFLAIQSNQEGKNKEKENLLVRNLALTMQDEISLASGATNGYSREFYVPETIMGMVYEISLIDSRVYIKSKSSAISLHIEKVEGEIQKGKNIIKKENDKVYINQ